MTTAPARNIELPLHSRRASVQPKTADEEERTVEVTWTTGALVARHSYFDGAYEEELSVEESAVRLDRLNNGAPLLNSHNSRDVEDQIGVVESAWISDGKGYARVRFAKTESVNETWQKVNDGILRNISVGYRTIKRTVTEKNNAPDHHLITEWEPYELSLVPIPADAHAQVRSTDPETRTYPCEITTRALPAPTRESEMTDQITPAESSATEETRSTERESQTPLEAREPNPLPQNTDATIHEALSEERRRIADLTDIAKRSGLPDDELARAIEKGMSVEDFRARGFDALAERSNQSRTSTVVVTRDEGETRSDAIREAIIAQMSRRPEDVTDRSRQYMNHSLPEMAHEALGSLSPVEKLRRPYDYEKVITKALSVRSHSYTDFTAIFEGALNARLLTQYRLAEPSYRRLAARRDFSDFRPHPQVRVGDFPELLEIGENGEIKAGTISESEETATLHSYARQIRISRQMLVNDNLGALDQMFGGYTRQIPQFENRLFYTMMTQSSGAGPRLLTDNKTVFHKDHGNLAETPGAPTVSTVSDARKALRKMKSQDGALLNVQPAMIVAGAGQETAAERLFAQITPASQDDVNPFSSKLPVISDAHLPEMAWYVFANPMDIPNFVYGFLDGAEGPRMRFEEPFGLQGIAMSVEHDFGCGATDYRGAYYNSGE